MRLDSLWRVHGKVHHGYLRVSVDKHTGIFRMEPGLLSRASGCVREREESRVTMPHSSHTLLPGVHSRRYLSDCSLPPKQPRPNGGAVLMMKGAPL